MFCQSSINEERFVFNYQQSDHQKQTILYCSSKTHAGPQRIVCRFYSWFISSSIRQNSYSTGQEQYLNILMKWIYKTIF